MFVQIYIFTKLIQKMRAEQTFVLPARYCNVGFTFHVWYILSYYMHSVNFSISTFFIYA